MPVKKAAPTKSGTAKAAAPAKKTVAAKAAAPAKKTATAKAAATAKKRVSKGESMVCEVCGLAVVVDEVGGVAVAEEDVLVCCGQPMKTRKTAASKKAAATK